MTKKRVSGERRFLMGSETEYMTVLEGSRDPRKVGEALRELLQATRELAPSMSCSAGFFSGYGRTYVDSGMHLEYATCECDSPYLLALILERQQELLQRAARVVRGKGHPMILANTNHDGLLKRRADTWGAHESYLVHEHPSKFAAEILPFLATRIYCGSGARRANDGAFLHTVRTEFLDSTSGGGTTGNRALHSTSREEHHVGPRPNMFRYHLISADAHRSQFNLALQFGATSLAIVAALEDVELRRRITELKLPIYRSWVRTAKQFNVLAKGDAEPSVDRRVIEVQRLYLEGAQRWVEENVTPDWTGRTLDDWSNTLDAYERGDIDWLARRLDAFAKYRLHASYLDDVGKRFSDLAGNEELLAQLALIDQDYHDIVEEETPFTWLEDNGYMEQRVGPRVKPGHEAEPFVPQVKTRALPRARFIAACSETGSYALDWAWIHDRSTGRFRELFDPFAETLSDEWKEPDKLTLPNRHGVIAEHLSARRAAQRARAIEAARSEQLEAESDPEQEAVEGDQLPF